jgi:hypothetical protein
MKTHFVLLFVIIMLICNCGENSQESSLKLVINEIMALNKTAVTDEYNEFDDWVELYNAGTDTIDIGGFYISDDLNLLTKCRVPDDKSAQTTILPDSFLVIWFDGQTLQGPLHTCCKLTGSGEDVVITEDDGETIINHYTYGPQTTDYSIGRSPDGSNHWELFDKPTPGASNQ